MNHLRLFCILLVFAGHVVNSQPHPVESLPSHITQITGFGERPEWSPDGKKILFVGKAFGDVFEYDLGTKFIRCLSLHFRHYGFTRAQYLSNGDILLAGPVESFDVMNSRERNTARDSCWLSVMDKRAMKPPVPLNIICAEGPAVSRHRLKIGWTERDRQKPELGKNRARLFTADIVYNEGVPMISNRKMVFDSRDLPFPLGGSSLETQSFVPPGDDKMTFTVYQINDGTDTEAYLLDLRNGQYDNLSKSSESYDEAEGIFPDGRFTTIEFGPSNGNAWPLIDIYKLALDGSGEKQRLTFFTEFEGYKASQSVISEDGRWMCFQIGKSGDEAGAGYGFFLYDLERK